MDTPYRTPPEPSVDLPARFRAEALGELEAGERVLWAGVPRAARLMRRAAAQMPLPVAWNGFLVWLVWGMAREGGALWLCAVPLLAIGLPLFAAPLDAWRAVRNTFYVLTDRRAIVFDGDDIVAYPATRLAAVVATEPRRDGSGDLVFATRQRRAVRQGFFGIADVRAVERLLRESLLS